jgi:5-hydroxyisourate hydrolase-like protein (transthyretin family)
MFLIILTFISAISISLIAAGYSIIGLATLFAGAATPIIAMGSALEVGKLVAASWLYNNWSENIPKTLKAYLFTAIIVLVFITSMGIFGFLSKAHLDQVRPTGNNAVQIALIDKQINQQELIIERAENTLNRLDKALDVYIAKEYVSRGLKERKKQKEERDFLNTEIKNAMDEIAKLVNAKSDIDIAQLKIEADVGPLKYVAELIYGENAKDNFDSAVRIIILILIFVFDPLAVLLLIAANISLKQWRDKRNEKKKIEEEETQKNKRQKDWQKEAVNAKARAKDYRDKQRVYKDFFGKLGKRTLNNRDYEEFFAKMGTDELKNLGLDPDEIRLKMDQIMEWNEPNNNNK